ncbi:MAG: xanthine dehydrogenase family protein molybdopterin-binding subunit [Deltaproteobacteria bacterium]|nr:xanthine dehydrogenase family protein molybdopterin-binding subunit [Deltaproteobacteria bacterium]
MHAAVVEVDTETGQYRVLKYVVVSDSGTMINPMVVNGQIHGIVAHGLGAATNEEFVYDQDGQLLTPTFLEYSCPQASDMPELIVDHLVTPSPFSAYGVKGMGEGSNPVPAVIAGAVEDALKPFAIRIRQSRITPEYVLGLIESAGSRGVNK